MLVAAAAGAFALILATAGSSSAARQSGTTPSDPNGSEPIFGLYRHEGARADAARLTADIDRAMARVAPLTGGSAQATTANAPAPALATSSPSTGATGKAADKSDKKASTPPSADSAAALDPLVPVGNGPLGVAANNTRAYVASASVNTVSVIDITTASVIATVPVGTFPVGAALSPDNSQAYITNYNSNTLSIIDTATNTVTSTVSVGSRPNGVIRVGSKVYVANLTGNSISVVDPATATVTATVVLGANPANIAPSGLAANGAGTRLYASDAKNGKLVVLDLTANPPTVLSNSTVVGTFPAYVAVAGTTGYVANPGSNSVSVLNLAPNPPTVTATVPVGTSDYGIAAQPSLNQVFVTNSGSDNMSVINATTNVVGATFATGTKPNAIAITPDGLNAIVSNQGDNKVSIFPIDQRPTNTVPGAQSVNANGTGSANKKTFSAGNSNLISIADSDAGSNPVKVTLSVNNGTLNLSGTGGLNFTSGANGTGAMTFTGTVTAINTALAGMQYTPTTGFHGADTLTITTDDQTNTGIGLNQTDTDTVSINVVNVAPVAGAITFTGAVGNTIFGVGQTPTAPETHTAGNVLSNSTDANNDTLSAVAGNITTTNLGTVVMSSNGTFTYITAPGGATGNDTFTFAVSDGITTTNGTATITVANRVWYVDNALGVNGNGRSTSPFNTLANLNGAGDADSPGDFIFLYQGSSNYAGGLALENNQTLVGQPQNLVVGAQTLRTGDGSNPTITNTGGAGITLANDVVIRRVNVTGTSQQGISGGAITNADIGPNLSITNSTGVGFSLNGAASGTVTMAGSITHSSGSARSVFIQNRTGGTVTISGAINDTGGGIFLNTNTGTTMNFTGGITSSTGSNGAAFTAQGGGTVSVTGTNTLTTTGANGLIVTGTSIGASGLTFQSINVGSGATPQNGILLNGTGSSGGLTVTGTGSAGSGGTIQNTTGDAISLTNVGAAVSLTDMATTNDTGTDVLVDGGAANVTYTGTITNQSGKGRSVVVQNRTGTSTVAFSGAINDSGTGINIANNSSTTTVNLTGGLVMSTGTNAAFNASSGGVVTVTGSANTITTTTGTALNVANTTIGASGLTFRSISAGTAASGPTNGIILNNTGTSGGLTVAGTGSAGTGGTIQKTGNHAISLNSTRNVNLSWMNIATSVENGINGVSVTNLNLTSCNLTNNGDDAGDDGIYVNNLLGTSTWSALSVTGSARNNVFIDNDSGTLDNITVSGASHFDSVSAAFGANAFLVQARGTAVITAGSVTGATFQNNKPARGVTIQAQETSRIGDASTNAFAVRNGVFTNNGLQASFEQSGSANLTFQFTGNGTAGAPMTMPNTASGTSHAVNVFSSSSSTGGTIKGRVTGNFIGNAGVAGSGSAIGNGIRAFIQGKTVATLLFDSNTIRQTPQARGMDIQVVGPLNNTGSGNHDITVTNNDVNPQDSTGFPASAIYVAADSQGGGTVTVRSNITGNTVPAGNAVDSLNGFLSLDRVVSAAVCQLVDTPPANANATAQLQATNTGSASAAGGCTLIAGPISTPP